MRTLVNLPNGNGKKIRIAVFCEEGKIKEAKDSGAEIAGFDTLAKDITDGKINFEQSPFEGTISGNQWDSHLIEEYQTNIFSNL